MEIMSVWVIFIFFFLFTVVGFFLGWQFSSPKIKTEVKYKYKYKYIQPRVQPLNLEQKNFYWALGILSISPYGKKAIRSDELESAYRRSAKRFHPDTGGTRAEWDQYVKAKEIMENQRRIAASK